MAADFDRIERDRDANECIAYENYWASRIREPDEAEADYERIWPDGILSRVSREAYYAVTRARGFSTMTPATREAAAVSYDQLKEEE